MRQHNIWCVYVRSVWRGTPDCSPAYLSKQSAQTAFYFTYLSRLVLKIFGFFEKHAQNLNTPQNISASWDLQVGFNSVA